MQNRKWTQQEKSYLRENFGSMTINKLAMKLNRSIIAVQQKAYKLGCGSWLNNMDFDETFNSFVTRCWGRNTSYKWYMTKMEEHGYRFKTIQRYDGEKHLSIKVITEKSFLNWLRNHKSVINIGETEEGCFGISEPNWVKEKRKIDKRANVYMKQRKWTNAEDEKLKMLLKSYKYGYREISIILKRTEGAIKRRMLDLRIIERPLRRDPHEKWTPEQIEQVRNLYSKGYPSVIIAEYLPKSALAINGILERYNYFGIEDRKRKDKTNDKNNDPL